MKTTQNLIQTTNLKSLKGTINEFYEFKKLKIYFLLSISLFFFTTVNFAQTIRGEVVDENGNPLSAKLLIKNISTPNIISEFVLVVNGEYSYVLKKEYKDDIILEVNSTGYSSAEKTIKPLGSQKVLELNFSLFKEKIQPLDEILIEGKKRPFNIKEDTIVYKVDAYKDGTEKKLEDLLKKLPGIEVNEDTGLVKYQGKLIETVTIEGDNLFDYNYTIGTKNINIDLVKEIEAIENYSENSLLKGIEQSNKVALNLKLKENKVDVSGNIDIGTGDFTNKKKAPLNTSTNLLGINKNYKSFAVVSYNNIGLNLSPLNYFTGQNNMEQIKEQDYYSEKIIPEVSFPNVSNENLSNINGQLFGNFNSVFNLSKRLKAKVNLFYINDEINCNQFSLNSYRINNDAFTTFDNTFINKVPNQYRGDLELKMIISRSSLLEYDISYRDEDIETDRRIFSNQENNFMSFLKSHNVFLKQTLQYTKKLTPKKAFQLSLLHSSNSLKQNFTIYPSILNIDGNSDFQNNNSEKHLLDFKAILLASRESDKYSLTFGASSTNEPFSSDLYSHGSSDISFVENGRNDLEYSKNVIYSLGSYRWKTGKFNITPNYVLRYIGQNLDVKENDTSISSNFLIFEPSLNVNYKINRISFFNLNVGLNNNTNLLQHLFPNRILVNNRLTLRNRPNLSLQKNQSFGFSYDKNDLYNQLELSFGVNYLKQRGNYFTNTQIDTNSIIVENFFLPENIESLDFNFNFSKLIPFIKTTFKINSSYSMIDFKNIVNDSELRNNKSNYLFNQIFLKTAFDSKINFENKAIYTYQETKNENLFKNTSFQNKFKIIIKPSKQVYGTFTFNYFIPNLENGSDNYSFLSSKISFKPNDKNWEINFTGTNLANFKTFGQFYTSDISTNINRVNLLNRFIMMNFMYNF